MLIEQLQVELEHVRIQEKVTIYEALIEYLMGRQLHQFLETEKALYLQKREFFLESESMATGIPEKLLELDTNIQTVSDKLLANAVKQVERLNYLDINGPDITKKIFLNRNEIIKLPENCFFCTACSSEIGN